MKLEEIEMLCNEATPGPWDFEYGFSMRLSSIMRKLLAVAKAARVAAGDGIYRLPEGGPSFYTVESRFIENLKRELEKLEKE